VEEEQQKSKETKCEGLGQRKKGNVLT